MKKKKKLGWVEYVVLYGIVYLRGKRVKMKSKRGSFIKFKGWKYKVKEDRLEI